MICLTGFMGSGKSTVGAALAHTLCWEFIDLDRSIVASQGRSIADIFSDEGEAAFRQIETAALRDILQNTHHQAVIALGGGTYIQANNRQLLSEAGALTVYLECEFEKLVDRCRQDGPVRPLLQDRDRARHLLEQRSPIYRQANLTVNVADRDPQAIADEIASLVRALPVRRAVPD